MKLLIGVINNDDRYPLIDALIEKGYRATIISTTGGFLREGNTTLLIGVQDESVLDVLKVIQANCRTRTKYVSPFPPVAEYEEAYVPMPVEVQVGGAVVFIVDAERFERF